ncbi:hypothetical protein BCR42DRAFT_397928 [Absidia repens]|uniref:Uncharacterized protein n=1 Tax=Absidia repens TaxID=90262 RepID=A0A1X2I018_9FUNG|nr:hypothetical protein BCR42DRAFT_397928 [Absidia repens]
MPAVPPTAQISHALASPRVGAEFLCQNNLVHTAETGAGLFYCSQCGTIKKFNNRDKSYYIWQCPYFSCSAHKTKATLVALMQHICFKSHIDAFNTYHFRSDFLFLPFGFRFDANGSFGALFSLLQGDLKKLFPNKYKYVSNPPNGTGSAPLELTKVWCLEGTFGMVMPESGLSFGGSMDDGLGYDIHIDLDPQLLSKGRACKVEEIWDNKEQAVNDLLVNAPAFRGLILLSGVNTTEGESVLAPIVIGVHVRKYG